MRVRCIAPPEARMKRKRNAGQLRRDAATPDFGAARLHPGYGVDTAGRLIALLVCATHHP
jgi:hypothetical protein